MEFSKEERRAAVSDTGELTASDQMKTQIAAVSLQMTGISEESTHSEPCGRLTTQDVPPANSPLSDAAEGELTHINEQGRPRMVDVSDKDITKRVAVAVGRIRMKPETLEKITAGSIAKGDVLGTAQVAGIMAAKRTWEIIPMCHPLQITGADISFSVFPNTSEIEARAKIKTTGKTGVEMEALHAVSAALLTIYDMCKAIDRAMEITGICLLEKEGGKSGHYER